MDHAWWLFSFKGRINRARYLAVQLALLVFWLVLLKFPLPFLPQWKALDWAVTIVMIWINLAATAKRLHDRDRNGWWSVAIFAVNRLSFLYYGLFLGLSFGVDISIGKELFLVMLAVVPALLQAWIIIDLLFIIGSDGPNRFGPDPTRDAPQSPVDSSLDPASVPAFLVSRAGPQPRR